MPVDRAESFSDLERAREVSRLLQPGSTPGAEAPTGTPPQAGRPGFSAAQARAFGGAAAVQIPSRLAGLPASSGVAPAPPTTVPARPVAAPSQGQVASVASASAPVPATAPAPAPAPAPTARASPSAPMAHGQIASPAARPAQLAPPTSGSWEVLLGWCRTSLAAEAAFVIDLRGLLVANAGTLADDDAQAMGARLVAALAQVDELEPAAPARSLAIDLSARCLTGVRLQPAHGEPLTVGLLSARPLAAGAAALVRRAFASKLAEE